jgi:hypothetical protein
VLLIDLGLGRGLAFPAALLSLIGRILSSSKLAARPQCLVRLQFLLAFRSLFVVPRCFETRLVSLSHLSEVVSSFISAGGLYRMNPGGAPHSYPCGHVMTSTIHVQGQKQKKGGGMISCCFTAILQCQGAAPDFERNRCRSSKSTSTASGCLCRYP